MQAHKENNAMHGIIFEVKKELGSLEYFFNIKIIYLL